MGWTGTSGNDVYYDYTGVNDMNGGDATISFMAWAGTMSFT
jgi:hypothetical protein